MEISLEEKKAIEKSKFCGGNFVLDKESSEVVLNLIEKLQKEIESWKSYSEELEEKNTEISNKKCELEFEVEKLQRENEEFKRLHIQDNKHLDFIMEHSITVQKVKDKIEELQKEYNKLDKQVDEYIKSVEKDVSTYYENKERISIMQTLSYFIDILKELIEERSDANENM